VLYNRTISPTLLNEARFNFTKFAFNEIESSMQTTLAYRASRLRVYFGRQSHSLWRAHGENNSGRLFGKTIEFRDIVSNVRGNHGLKFGGEFRPELNDDALNGGSRPLYTFAGLFNFANDTPLFYQINANPETGGLPTRNAIFDRAVMVCFSRTTGKRGQT
jgi:hypothetical protein